MREYQVRICERLGEIPRAYSAKAAVSKRNKMREQKVWTSLSPDQPV